MNTQTNKILAREISFPVQGRNTFQGKGRTLIKKKFPENTGEFSLTFLNVFVKSSKLLWVFILPFWSSHKLRDSSIFDGAFTQVCLQEVNSRRSVTKKNSLDNFMLWITQNPTTKKLKNLLKFERTKKKQSEGSRRNKYLLFHKRGFMSASQKDLYRNIFWHRTKKINEKWAATRSVSRTPVWKFRPSLSICFYSLCSVVGLRSFGQRAQGTTLFSMAMVPRCAASSAAPTWPWG